MNILITQASWPTNNLVHDGWGVATSFFTQEQLLHTIATLSMIQNDIDDGEYYDRALDETIEELIGNRISDEDKAHPAPTLSDDERHYVSEYLKDSVKALRPYMPSGGSLELITFVNEPEKDKFHLVVRYHPEDEHSGKAFTNPRVRG